jgi:hypothetical protein
MPARFQVRIRDWVRSFSSSKIVFAVAMTAATLVVAPYAIWGYRHGHDLEFHITSWLEISRQFREGIPHPRWAELANFGYGEPRFVFYPPVSFYLGGILARLFPLRMAISAYIWVVVVLAGFSFFHLCRHFFGIHASLLGAFVYAVNPYCLLEAYTRSSFAELLVSTTFPLLMLAIYRLHEGGRSRIAIASLFFAVVWLTNIPGAVVASYGATAFVIGLILTRQPRPGLIGKFLLAGVLGVGLDAFYLLPAWYEQPWIHASYFSFTGTVRSLFLPFPAASHLQLFLAIMSVHLVEIFAAGVTWAFSRTMKPRDIFWAFSILLAASGVMILPISAAIWHAAPFLRYVQFPFRWLGAMSLAMAFFVAAAADQSKKGRVIGAVTCSICVAMIPVIFFMDYTRVDNLASLQQSISQGLGYRGTLEYLPRDVSVRATPGDDKVSIVDREIAKEEIPSTSSSPAQQSDSFGISVTHWSAENRELTVNTPQPIWVRVRLYLYPGWDAYIRRADTDAPTRLSLQQDSRGAVVFPVQSGRNDIKLRYEGTPDQAWGIVLSALSVLVFLGMLRK